MTGTKAGLLMRLCLGHKLGCGIFKDIRISNGVSLETNLAAGGQHRLLLRLLLQIPQRQIQWVALEIKIIDNFKSSLRRKGDFPVRILSFFMVLE
jgi:hypothetical protein